MKKNLGMKERNVERNVAVFKRHLDGETNRSSAQLYNLSDELIRRILLKWFRVLRHPYYTENFPYPFPKETHPHLWYTNYEGSSVWWLDRKKLKPEERALDKNHWLNLLEFHLQRNQ